MQILPFSEIWRRYRLVPTIAVLAGIIAFVGSFVVAPTYAASTRLLVRGRDTTFLSGKGTDLSRTPGVIDSALATALGETQSALVSSNAVADMVVKDLHLDQKRPTLNGPIAKARRAFATVYKHTRAYVTYGQYKQPDRYTAAVQAVDRGLSAAPVKDSYVLEITATADTPKLAAGIADSAAKSLLTISSDRFRAEAARYRDFLKQQLDTATNEASGAAQSVSDYMAANGIADVNEELTLTAQSAEGLRQQLAGAQAERSDAGAQLKSIEASLAGTNSDATNTQRIQTGRSETQIDNTQPNATYQSLLSQKALLRAQVSGLDARINALTTTLGRGQSASPLSAQQAQLRSLELQRTTADASVQDLASQYQDAVVASDQPNVELTRIDHAAVPTYPVSPTRYLYLAIGIALGAVLGFVISQLRVLRTRQLDDDEASAGTNVADGVADKTTVANDTAIDLTAPIAVPSGAMDVATTSVPATTPTGAGGLAWGWTNAGPTNGARAEATDD